MNLKSRKLFNIFTTAITIALFVVFTGAYIAQATYPDTPYYPGETTNPDCAPGDSNCSVVAPLSTTLTATTTITMDNHALNFDSGTLYIDSINNRVGIGTASPSGKLTVVGGDMYIGDGSTTSTFSKNNLILGGTTTDALGKFYVDSAGNISASGTLNIAGLSTFANLSTTGSISAGGNVTSTGILYALGGLISSASSTFSSGLNTTGNILPTNNNLVDLGAYGTAFNDVYASGTAYLSNLNLTNVSSTGITASSYVSSTYLIVSSPNVTSTFGTGGLTVGTDDFVVQQSSGNVGIGTTNPGNVLTVVGSTEVRETDDGNTAILLSAGSGSGSITLRNAGATTISLNGSNNTNSYFNSSGGKVGIGTASPTDLLTLYKGNLSVGDGTVSSTLSANFLAIATSTANMNGLFYVNSAGNVSASGSIFSYGNVTSTGHIYGSTNNAADLGGYAYAFRDIYASGTAYLSNLNLTNVSSTGITASSYVSSTNLYVSGPAYFVAGSVGAPGIAFGHDTNTGFYTVASDRIGVTLGGVVKLDLSSAEIQVPGSILAVGATSMSLKGQIANSSSAVGVKIGNYTELTTEGSHIVNFYNDSVTTLKSFITWDGGMALGVSTTAGYNSGKFFVDGTTGVVSASSSLLTYGNVTSTGHIYGSANNTVDLGSYGYAFRNVYASGTLYASSILVGDGTIGAPTYSFGGDLNTGVYRPSADVVAIVTGGIQSGYFSTTELNVRSIIAPISTGNSLVLKGYASDGATAIGLKLGNLNKLVTAGAKILSFYSDNVSTLRSFITWDGGFAAAVSTTAGYAGGKFFVDGTSGNIYSSSTLALTNTTMNIVSSTAAALRLAADGANGLQFWTNGAQRMFLDSAGNLGIGTTTPYATLSVAGTMVVSSTSEIATSTITGNLDIGGGALVYNYTKQVLSIPILEISNLNYKDDAGQVSWVDMNVTTASASGTIMSYAAQINSNAVMIVYGIVDSAGYVSTTGVTIGTSTLPSTVNTYKLYVEGDSDTSAGLGVRGFIKATDFISSTSTLDLAENYPIDVGCYENDTCPEKGDLVCLAIEVGGSTVRKCNITDDENILGAVSTRPGFLLGGYEFYNPGVRPVALAGRVPMHVSLENGSIHAGDYLTISTTTPGYAVRSTAPGRVIGMAMNDFIVIPVKTGIQSSDTVIPSSPVIQSEAKDLPLSAVTLGTIDVFVKPQWNIGDGGLADYANEMNEAINPVASNLLDKFTSTIKASLKKLGVIVHEGAVKISSLWVKEVHTEKICIGETCVTEEIMKQMLNGTGATAAPASVITPSADPVVPESSPVIPAEAAISPSSDPVTPPSTVIPLKNGISSPDNQEIPASAGMTTEAGISPVTPVIPTPQEESLSSATPSSPVIPPSTESPVTPPSSDPVTPPSSVIPAEAGISPVSSVSPVVVPIVPEPTPAVAEPPAPVVESPATE